MEEEIEDLLNSLEKRIEKLENHDLNEALNKIKVEAAYSSIDKHFFIELSNGNNINVIDYPMELICHKAVEDEKAKFKAKIVEMLKKEAITARKIDMIDRSGYQEFCRDIIQKINEMETSSKEVSSRTGKWNEKTGLFE